MIVRIQKILSQRGIASRRRAELLISEGKVLVNGQVARFGQQADPDLDHIIIDGKPLTAYELPVLTYLLLHKPLGVISTCFDPWGRPTVLDFVKGENRSPGLHPVGRLDTNSTGALLLTNDGSFTYCLTHPRYHISKTYEVWIQGKPSLSILNQWQTGVILDNQITLPAQITVIRTTNDRACLKVILTEGRNRQIRRVAEVLGHPVISLHRQSIGFLELGELPIGHYRFLKKEEVEQLQLLEPPLD